MVQYMRDDVDKVLELKGVTVKFNIGEKELVPVNNVSLCLRKKEIIGLVGESGCGKSMTAYSIVRLVPYPGRVTGGEIMFEDKDLLKLTEEEMRKIRGAKISMVFQDPLSSLNPCFKIYWHLNEIVQAHRVIAGGRERSELIMNSLSMVRIPEPQNKAFQYPHQFSGGMRQRVVIGMALICRPSIVIADEPTTALDVTVQKEILDLIEELRTDLDISIIVISHDLYLIAERCDRVYVMYAGEIAECARSEEIFDSPLHPYTKGLLTAIPKLGGTVKRLQTIRGEVQDLTNLPRGCFFSPRCDYADDFCVTVKPDLKEVEPGRLVRCHRI